MDEYGEIYENEDLDPIGSNMFINVGESSDEEGAYGYHVVGQFGEHDIHPFGVKTKSSAMQRTSTRRKRVTSSAVTKKVSTELPAAAAAAATSIFNTVLSDSDLQKYRFAFSSHDKDNVGDPTHSFTIDLTHYHDIKNLVGFNILRASIPITHYPINGNNNLEILIGTDSLAEKLVAAGYSSVGYFDVHELAEATGATYNTNTKKYTFASDITWPGGGDTIESKQIAKIFGLIDGTTLASGVEAPNSIDIRGTSFIDIEIGEIPSILCIQSNHSDHIVARIPIIEEHGTTQEYHARTVDLNTRQTRNNEDLLNLTVKLRGDNGAYIDLNGGHIHLVCEAIVMSNL
jgi:hypothetical protein